MVEAVLVETGVEVLVGAAVVVKVPVEVREVVVVSADEVKGAVVVEFAVDVVLGAAVVVGVAVEVVVRVVD